MARNTLVINCDIRETRVALIEDGVIAELQIERASAMSTVGNIVLGRVSRVLPGMQAAFIDVGMDRAAFLHVEDLIRPDDFEAYLSGGAREDHQATARGVGTRRPFRGGRNGVEEEEEDDDDDRPLLDDDQGEDPVEVPKVEVPEDPGVRVPRRRIVGPRAPRPSPSADTSPSDPSPVSGKDSSPPGEAHGRDGAPVALGDDPSSDEEEVDEVALDDEAPDDLALDDLALDDVALDDVGPDDESSDEDALDDEDDDDLLDDDDVPNDDVPTSCADGDEELSERAGDGETEGEVSNVSAGEDGQRRGRREEPDGAARSRRTADDRTGRGRRRRRRGKKGAPPEPVRGRESAEKPGRRHGKVAASRVSRSVPITEVVKEGDEVIVQISKEPIGTKGARVTSHVSLPGRYVVYLPTLDHVGISKRIGSARERVRLREVMEALKPEKGGLIVRTVAEGLTKKGLKADVGYLIKLWADVSRRREGARAPAVLYTELDLVLKTARDLFTEEIEKIVIDDKEQYGRLVRFVEMFMPERAKDIELYAGAEPVFDAYGIEDEIGRALSRKVPLPSGGYLIIDQAEALTAIDVNTGRYVGKGSKDLEETALKTNLEAVEEIAYQLRFRNIGGLVILDLIDMDSPSNREKVWRELERLLAKDKAKTTLNRISELGLIEMTRKRTRESLSRTMHEPCFYCDGTGQIASRTTIGYEILRQIRRERDSLKGYCVVVNAHPAIVDLMQGEERTAVEEAERRYMRRIEFNACREYHIEQFDLAGR
ncbi:MAG: Rne/Rng family ribonuclease [Polyangiaceae bacterium]|nr:Rne/Rng family ribonuclease [Polyangiaceae bacterium]